MAQAEMTEELGSAGHAGGFKLQQRQTTSPPWELAVTRPVHIRQVYLDKQEQIWCALSKPHNGGMGETSTGRLRKPKALGSSPCMTTKACPLPHQKWFSYTAHYQPDFSKSEGNPLNK